MNEKMYDEIKEKMENDKALGYRFITNQRKVFFGLDVTAQYWGRIKNKSGKTAEGINELNCIRRIRRVCAVGFGETAEEATNEALKEIYARIHGIGKFKDIKYDFAKLTSVCPLCSQGSAQCFIDATLYQIDKKYEDGEYGRRRYTTSVFCQS